MGPKISVNARFLTQRLTGVQRYAAEVLRRLPTVTLLSPSEPASVYRAVTDRHRLIIRTIRLGKLKIQGHPWEQLVLPFLLPNRGWLWSPGGSGPLSVTRQIVTVHDVAHLEHPTWYNWKFAQFYRWLLPRLLKRIAYIITVSEFSKNRIIEWFRLPPDRVFVTPLGVGEIFFSPLSHRRIGDTLSRYNLKMPYFITVSAISERKNLKRVLQAWEMANLNGVELVVVGARDLAFAGKTDIPSNPSVRYIGYVPDEDLVALYSGAMGALCLSLYEGFGLPALEAMASGTPLLASNVTAIPEVVGDAGLLVDPYDVEAIAWGIKALAEDQALRENLRKKGLERAKHFSWQKTAELTWALFERIVQAG